MSDTPKFVPTPSLSASPLHHDVGGNAAYDAAVSRGTTPGLARPGLTRLGLSRRNLLRGGGSLVMLLGSGQLAFGASIVAVRVWPSKDYTRVTIESDVPLKTEQRFVPTPPRLAVDIEGIDLNPALRELVAKVRSDDPNIAGIRVGQNSPQVVRLVIDLKHDASPQVFTLKPFAPYQHRLVLDLYPAKPADPLESLIAERLLEGRSTAVAAAPAPMPPQPSTVAPSVAAAMAGDPPLPAVTGTVVQTPPPATVAAAPAVDPLGDLIAKSGNRPAAPAPAPTVVAMAPPPAPVAPPPPPRPAPVPSPAADPLRALTDSSSWRSTPATAEKTRAPAARAARAKKTSCSRSAICCASASTTPASAAIPCAPS